MATTSSAHAGPDQLLVSKSLLMPGSKGKAIKTSKPSNGRIANPKQQQRSSHVFSGNNTTNKANCQASDGDTSRHQLIIPPSKTLTSNTASAHTDLQRGIRKATSKRIAPSSSISRKSSSKKANNPQTGNKKNPPLGKAASQNRSGLPVPPAIRMAKDKEINPRVSAGQNRGRIGNNRPSAITRPGRQFTVGNIGHNGTIYLRPVIRPATELQQHRQPLYPLNDVIPPPDQGLRPIVPRRRNSSIGHESVMSSAFSYRRTQDGRKPRSSVDGSRLSIPSRKPSHIRSHSFSTADGRASRPNFSQPGTYKVVIRPTSGRRPLIRRASEDTVNLGDDVPEMPSLGVNIPSFRLGQPQFGPRGSAAFTRDSIQQTRSREISQADATSGVPSSYLSPPHDLPAPLNLNAESTEVLVPRAATLTQSPRVSLTQFAMHVFDDLSHNPDDTSVVRFSPMTDDIIAATPSRLIAHITSPDFLDYELLSDFFLTYRAFLLSIDLVSFLLARLRWSVERVDDFGRIVRVRTFVGLRHWILNYFSDDFAPDFALRAHFCNLVNGLYQDLQRRSDGGAGDLKIIGELKKCWRRTCALFWPSEKTVPAVDEDIYPGGHFDSEYWQGEEAELAYVDPSAQSMGQIATVSRPVSQKKNLQPEKEQKTPKSSPRSGRSVKAETDVQLSPTSIQSLHVISCSIPFKPIYKNEPSATVPLFPHPALRPLETVSNASYPGSKHKRSGSLDYTMREQRMSGTSGNVATQDLEDGSMVPGTLVHGALYQPSNPVFEIKSVVPKQQSLRLDIPSIKADSGPTSPIKSPTNSESMKKLFGSVRRALSNNLGLNSHPVNGSNASFYSNDPKGSGSNLEVAGTERNSITSQVRIDLLCSLAGDRFKAAIEQENREAAEIKSNPGEEPSSPSQNFLSVLNARNDPRFPLNRSVTVGSRSIVIVDDTNSDAPVMSGALSPVFSALSPTSPVAQGYHARGFDLRSEDDVSTRQSHISNREPPEIPPRKSHIATPAVYIPGGAKTITTAGVYVPTGFQTQQVGVADQDRVLPRGSRDIFRNSMRNDTRSSAIRRYASYHSGFAGSPRQASFVRSDVAQDSASRDDETNDASSTSTEQPIRQLRRRPGGNLKAVTKVHDLETRIPRRHSVGSLSTISKSLPGSMISPESMQMSGKVIPSVRNTIDTKAETIASTNQSPKIKKSKSISLIHTHSSQPNLRPSFEAEVAKLKALPDDDDDGGIDATLLKLEGKYEKRSPTSGPDTPLDARFSQIHSDDEADEDKHRKHHEHVEDIHPEHTLSIASYENPQTRSILHVSTSTAHKSQATTHKRDKSNASEAASFDPVPLLERGQDRTELKVMNPSPNSSKRVSSEAEKISRVDSAATPVTKPSKPMEIHEPITPLPRIKSKKQPKARMNTVTSFLLDDAEEFSDEEVFESSSEEDDYDVHSFFDDRDIPNIEQISSTLRHPDTPPDRLVPRMSSSTHPTSKAVSREKIDQEILLATSPVVPTTQMPRLRAPVSTPVVEQHEEFNEKAQSTARSSQNNPPHLPFILAYQSDHLARQFTILEKDALDEIDWRELIELRWDQNPPPASDWVTFLRAPDPFGVGLVIARFNLMVKWVISEIILTDSVHERARVITHYIQIAAHCRRLRNFATMYQITVALLSADCSRLKRTWSLVSQNEISILQDLERVVQPLRNFHNLRLEMETAPSDAGCIPFIGVYTRDLVYNAQKPAVITSPPQNPYEPLINFERHHTAAGIVKSLLRLLEQAARYNFTPDPVCLSRCLWMAALSEAEIRQRSERLE